MCTKKSLCVLKFHYVCTQISLRVYSNVIMCVLKYHYVSTHLSLYVYSNIIMCVYSNICTMHIKHKHALFQSYKIGLVIDFKPKHDSTACEYCYKTVTVLYVSIVTNPNNYVSEYFY